MSNIQDLHEQGSNAATAPTAASSSTTHSTGNGTVFISYRRSDGKDYAKELRDLLRAAGLDAWQDTEDLDHGVIADRVTKVIAQAQAAVLIVTPDIVTSEVVRNIELPALLERAKDPSFAFIIANAVEDTDSHSENGDPQCDYDAPVIANAVEDTNSDSENDDPQCDYDAPDQLLGHGWKQFANRDQVNLLSPSGAVEVASRLLKNHLEQRQDTTNLRDRDFHIHINTRWDSTIRPQSANEDLHILLEPSKNTRLLSAESMGLLRKTLPLISSAVQSSRTQSIRISGHAHLSVGLALGAALPETMVNTISVDHTDGQLWSSRTSQESSYIGELNIDSKVITTPSSDETPRIAVFVNLLPSVDSDAFDKLIDNRDTGFHTVARISRKKEGNISSHEAAHLSSDIATQIKELARSINGASQTEVHLAYAGPLPMAVLIGRLLNTLITVVYEYDNNAYIPVFSLNPGQEGGPITAIC